MISEANAVSFGARSCHLAGRRPPILGTWELFWQLGGTLGAKGAAEGTPWRPEFHFGSFPSTLEQHLCFSHACSRFPSTIFWSEAGRGGGWKASIWCERVCKKQLFAGVGSLLLLGSVVLYGLGTNFHDIWYIESGLKFIDFHAYLLGQAQIQATHPDRGDLDPGWVPN